MSDSIEKTVELNAPVSRVWRALTDHAEFGRWFGVKVEGPFVAGQVARGRKTNPCSANAEWKAVIKAMEPERLFSFTWQPYAVDPDYDYSGEAPTLVTFKLTPIPGGTLLRVVESGFDRIPAHRRAESFQRNENGWSIQMQNIAEFLAHAR